MAANRYGIDMADIYRTTAAVKGARTANEINKFNLEGAKSDRVRASVDRLKAEERTNALSSARGAAAAGGEDAGRQLLVLDPENGPAFLEALSTMDEKKREATRRTVEEVGNLSSYVLQGKDEKEQARRYGLMYQSLSPNVQKTMPEQYDPQFVELSLSKAMSMDKLLENPKAVTMGGENVLYKGGREIDRAGQPPKAPGQPNVLKFGKEDLLYQDGKEISRTDTAVKPGAGGTGGLKSADESLMYRQTVELLGGLFDEMGNITSLDPAVRNKVQAIATEATKIFRDDGTVTRSQAVRLAAKKFRMDIPDVPEQPPDGGFGGGEFQPSGNNQNAADPNNIRQYLLQN